MMEMIETYRVLWGHIHGASNQVLTLWKKRYPSLKNKNISRHQMGQAEQGIFQGEITALLLVNGHISISMRANEYMDKVFGGTDLGNTDSGSYSRSPMGLHVIIRGPALNMLSGSTPGNSDSVLQDGAQQSFCSLVIQPLWGRCYPFFVQLKTEDSRGNRLVQ